MLPDPNDLINAIGAMCEIAGFMYKHLMSNGFSEQRAFEIVSEYILNTLLNNGTTKGPDEEYEE